MCNLKSDGVSDSALVQYYFFQIVSHNQLSKFCGKYIELNVSYWKCLFEENFGNLKILNLALSCNDLVLELIPKYCPQLEYLNATSKYLFRDAPTFYRNTNRMLQLPVSDAGLSHLQACKKLRVLIVNEPRGEYPIATNQITYNGLRFLLRHIPTLEDISYSDIGYVITTKFGDVNTLNLNVIRHIHPSESSIREILRLCKNIRQFNLNGLTSERSTTVAKEICASEHQFKDIEFQNIYFDDYFDAFFAKFGEHLVSISLSYTQAELCVADVITISIYCPNVRFFLCNNLLNKNCIPIKRSGNVRPFVQLKSLYLSGCNIEMEVLLKYCTEFAINLEIVKIHELTNIRNVDDVILKCINSANLKQLELSRLLCSRNGIDRIIDKFPKLNFLIVQCTENCNELMQRMRAQNYELILIIKRSSTNPYY